MEVVMFNVKRFSKRVIAKVLSAGLIILYIVSATVFSVPFSVSGGGFSFLMLVVGYTSFIVVSVSLILLVSVFVLVLVNTFAALSDFIERGI